MRAAVWLAMVFPVAACMTPAPAPTPTPDPAPRHAPAPRATPPPRPTPEPRSTPEPRETADRVVAPDEPFELALGEAAEIRGTGLRIRFASVAEDSRCPTGAQCIVAGQARIRLDVSEGEQRPAVVELSTERGSTDAAAGNQTIQLLEVTPHPSLKRSIQPADYRARLVVGNL